MGAGQETPLEIRSMRWQEADSVGSPPHWCNFAAPHRWKSTMVPTSQAGEPGKTKSDRSNKLPPPLSNKRKSSAWLKQWTPPVTR